MCSKFYYYRDEGGKKMVNLCVEKTDTGGIIMSSETVSNEAVLRRHNE